MDNAYSRIYAAMQSAGKDGQPGAPVHIRIGTVLSSDPLAVDVGGTTQEADRFYSSGRLLRGSQENVTLQGEASGSFAITAACPLGSHTDLSIRTGTLSLDAATLTRDGPVLQRGDLVLLLTEDDQTFYLLDKVVHL